MILGLETVDECSFYGQTSNKKCLENGLPKIIFSSNIFCFFPPTQWKDFVNESNECLPIRQRALYDIWYAFSNRIACRVKISAMVLENYIYDDGWSETYMYDWGYIYYWELAAHHREKGEYEAGGKEWSGMVWKQNRRLRGLETGDWTPISGLKGDYWCVSTLDCAATERHLKGTQRTTVLFLPVLPILLSILIGYVSVLLVRSDIDSFPSPFSLSSSSASVFWLPKHPLTCALLMQPFAILSARWEKYLYPNIFGWV